MMNPLTVPMARAVLAGALDRAKKMNQPGVMVARLRTGTFCRAIAADPLLITYEQLATGDWAPMFGGYRLVLTDEVYESAPRGFRSKQMLAVGGSVLLPAVSSGESQLAVAS
jgi:hypothetical protein